MELQIFLPLENWQDQPDQLGGEDDRRDHGVPDFLVKVQKLHMFISGLWNKILDLIKEFLE